MTTLVAPSPSIETLADLMERLGDVPLSRVRFKPPPGTATEADVIAIDAHEDRLCELVDGVLVEKAMGYKESALTFELGGVLRDFVKPRRLGKLSGEAGMITLFPGLVRIPDLAYVSRERYATVAKPIAPIPHLIPELVVEVLSISNTRKEMVIKRREYFEAGVLLIWMVDLKSRTVQAFTSPDESILYNEEQTLDGGSVLPGFTLNLKNLFSELDEDVEE